MNLPIELIEQYVLNLLIEDLLNFSLTSSINLSIVRSESIIERL